MCDWYFNVSLISMLGTGICITSSGLLRQCRKEIMWQVDMRYVVLSVRDCLSVLLSASITFQTL